MQPSSRDEWIHTVVDPLSLSMQVINCIPVPITYPIDGVTDHDGFSNHLLYSPEIEGSTFLTYFLL